MDAAAQGGFLSPTEAADRWLGEASGSVRADHVAGMAFSL